MNLVTGGTGLVGAHLCVELLRRGEKVRVFARKANASGYLRDLWQFYQEQLPFPSDRVEWVNGDILDVAALQEAMVGCTRVFHTAALVSYHRRDREEMYRINAEGTANVVNACIAQGIEVMCHVSSIAALGRLRHGQVVSEKDDWADSPMHTHYATSKHLAELEVWRGREEGLRALIVNPGFILGPGPLGQSSGAVFEHIARALPYYPKGGTGFVHAADVAQVMVELTLNGVEGERVLVVAQNRSFEELWTEASRALGVKPPTKPAPDWILKALWVLAGIREWITGKKAMVTSETIRNTSVVFTYDNAKLKRLYPGKLRSMEEAVADAVKFISSRRP